MKTLDAAVATKLKQSLPATFLNAYALLDANRLQWPVALYRFTHQGSANPNHEDRGHLKNLMWKIRGLHQAACRGYGFIIDVDRERVAIPQSWRLPEQLTIDGYDVNRTAEYVAHAADPRDHAVVVGIVREAIKKHFKDKSSTELGELWQDYDSFCEMPQPGRDFLFCRRYGVSVERLGQALVIQCQLNTVTLDGKTFAEYYQTGTIDVLVDLIAKKRLNRVNRDNRPIDVRVWCDQSYDSKIGAVVLSIHEPQVIEEHAGLPTTQREQILSLACRAYQKNAKDIPLTHLRLILDSQITGTNHHETIINPPERLRAMNAVRSFINGAEAFGQRLSLASEPFDPKDLQPFIIAPPATRVRGSHGMEEILLPPVAMTAETLRKRSGERARQIREHGFLQTRPINPALCWPNEFGRNRATRMRNDLNHLLRGQGIAHQFAEFSYDNVSDIRRITSDRSYDALLVVLPEGSRAPHTPHDTHEQLKRIIEVPTQCIQHDNTLPKAWADRPVRELVQRESQLARRVRNSYALCVENLFVKHGWIPFVPADASHYNVHVGLDVGGVHNTRAMACLGYGFGDPSSGLLFRPDEIPVDVQKAEPIPTHSLYGGLLRLFEFVYEELRALGGPVNFEKTLFFRDGAFLGDGDAWNELTALTRLHAEFLRRGWITSNSVWTGAEISKQAGSWRLFRNDGRVDNPIVGQGVLLDPTSRALLATTGAPYLRNGTAAPVELTMRNIHGRGALTEVIRDFVWEADFGLTKTDMGSRLPWVLKVADTGALQTARSYHVTGITV